MFNRLINNTICAVQRCGDECDANWASQINNFAKAIENLVDDGQMKSVAIRRAGDMGVVLSFIGGRPVARRSHK